MSMKLGIMQPYFLPYIGYFQLIKAVDKYVIYDDVNFIKGGWINRNRILLNGSAFMINVPMQGASSFKKINEVQVGVNKERVLLTIEQAYRKAPFYSEVKQLILDIIEFETPNLALYITNSIIKISTYLKIDTEFLFASEINKNNELKAQDKVIAICKTLNAKEYYNAIGGMELYNKIDFFNQSIELKFLNPKLNSYQQFENEFISGLSILDVLMFNSVEDINVMLDNYELI